MKKLSILLAAISLAQTATSFAQIIGDKVTYPYTWTTTENPVVKHVYACDPSAKVFEDGKIWVVTSHDADDARGYWTMLDYHVYSTSDLKTWTDHGVVLSVDDVAWATSDMWAPDFSERNGKYYLYTPAGKEHRIGVFVSDSPTGPYKDALGKPLIPIYDAIDPMVYIDDDGQAYMYFSRKGKYCYVVKLKENMIEIEGEIVELTNKSLRSTTDGEYQFVEGPYIHKRNGVYYMTYPGKMYKHGAPYNNHDGDEFLCYAVSDSPMGPFTAKGRISETSGIHTFHQAVINLDGEDYMFYHTGNMAKKLGVDDKYTMYRRSMSVNKLHYDEDGTIKFFEQKEQVFE